MYLNVDEVESALTVAAAAPYAGFTQLITLPNLTWEARQCHAIKIANGSGPGRPGVYFLGGIHSREWGSCDILINFIEQLEQAYSQSTGLTFGSQSFSADDIQTIVDTLDIIVFPQANPDGRNYSINTEALWRKNRRTAAPNSTSPDDCVGVDVNRNYDFLWDFPTYFDVTNSAIQDSTNPCDPVLFNGPSAFSEPESQNAKWIFDNYPNVAYFIDLHSYGELILYSWGDDQDQTTQPSMNFQNPAYDGKRGVANDAYNEYIPQADLTTAVALANTLQSAIAAYRGTNYTVEQSYGLYPTAGTSDDYAYSRHFVDSTKQKIIAYTLEWGVEFQPPYSEMQNIIAEITGGLLAFCLSVRNSLKTYSFLLDRDHFGQDEVDGLRAQTGHGRFTGALFVIVDGFTPKELGIVDASSLSAAPAVTFSPAAGLVNPAHCSSLESDDPSFGPGVQRFRFGYDVDFGGDDTAFTSFSGDTETVVVSTTFQGLPPISAQLTLIKQPDPYIMQGPETWWLSNDIRLIQVATGDTSFGVPMGTDPFAFLASVTAALEAGVPQGTAGGQSFDKNTQEDTEVISVAPTTERHGQTVNVYNFAIARVHYQGLASTAKDVRVFFRLFAANSTATDFESTSTYRRFAAYSPAYPVPAANFYQNVLPTAGVQAGEYVSIPCFAEARKNAAQSGAANTLPSLQTPDAPNVRTLPPTGNKAPRDYFFGAFLDINEMTPVIPAMPPGGNVDGPWPPASGVTLEPLRQAFIVNEHTCLVAEIAFDPDPVADGTQPWNSDKFAQRNISWSYIANPGLPAASRLALEPFEVRPSPAALAGGDPPDELMIDWKNVPARQHAEIYLPKVDASAVLATASQLYRTHRLSVVDANTIGCETGGVTYIPLPQGSGDGANFAGLLSVQMPFGIRKGQLYTVLIRQLTNAFGSGRGRPNPLGAQRLAVAGVAKWRRVLGTFQVNIPVSTKEMLLPKEERRLSIFRWIGDAMPPERRWYPVFARYLEGIAQRVGAFGGNPIEIWPSPTGEGRPQHRPVGSGDHVREYTGKIDGLIFDHFGDFEGFWLETSEGKHEFASREAAIRTLAERAWRERLRISIFVEGDKPKRPLTIVLREPPASL